MEIVCISDTHNRHREINIPKGNVIIHAGDATGRGSLKELADFINWYGELDFSYKILIAGNHDFGFEKEPALYAQMCKNSGIIYLNDSSAVIKDFDTGEDIRIWGSPVQPEFGNWAFNRRITEEQPMRDLYHGMYANPYIKPHWDLIPNDVDIVVTHGPPEGILDEVISFSPLRGESVEHVGCPHLLEAIKRTKPKLHVFGHIHDQHGIMYSDGVMFANVACLNDFYNVEYKPRIILWEDGPKLKY